MILGNLYTSTLVATARDVVPIVIVVAFFQLVVLRRPIGEPRRLLGGLILVVLGLAIFLIGLELALFPLGTAMTTQLASPEFIAGGRPREPGGEAAVMPAVWYQYYWVYLFAFAIGVSSAFAEPALIALASKASEISGGTIKRRPLRLVAALGVGVGVSLGTLRIVIGHPLPYYILPGYMIVLIQTRFAPKAIIPIAFDSSAVTTSTVTVPIVTALGLGLATQIEGASPLVDGFGLIAFASLFAVSSVLGYGQFSQWLQMRRRSHPDAL